MEIKISNKSHLGTGQIAVSTNNNIGKVNFSKAAVGVQGPEGPQGSQGIQGTIGSQGSVGLQGFSGIQGLEGSQGFDGSRGVQGSVGSQGLDGIQGSKGTQGFNGTQGTFGTQGAQGDQGIQGVKGNDGTSVEIKGSVPTANVYNFNLVSPSPNLGEGWIAIDTGHLWVYTSTGPIAGFADVGNITGPQGATGSIGVQGLSGIQGSSGYDGIQGSAGYVGADGAQGTIGSQGSAGYVGADGTQGTVGTQGSAGYVGADGAQGTIGSQGSAGYVGADGAQGVIGSQGTEGAQGSAGYVGADGTQGTVGTQGSAGYVGADGTQGTQGLEGSQGVQGTQGDVGPSSVYQDDILVINNANLNFQNTQTANIVLSANGTEKVNISVDANLSSLYDSANTVAVSQNSSGTLYKQSLNFVNTDSILISVGDSGDGNANIEFKQSIYSNTIIYVSENLPPSPNSNVALWWRSDVGSLKIYYNDGNSEQWVDAFNAQRGAQGIQGLTGTKGDTGSFGGASFNYIFDSSTDDPLLLGNGLVKFNYNPFDAAGTMIISFIDSDTANIFNYLTLIDDSTSTIKGQMRISETANIANYAFFNIVGNHTHNDDHFMVPIAYTNGSVNTFSNTTNVTLNFVRSGDKGDTGSQGAQGTQGTFGSQGTYGIQGIPGFGFNGSQGTQGTAGFIGTNGIQGTSGSNGTQGTTGFNGTQGVNGSQGTQGTTGFNGTQGVNGTQGTTGSQGVQGLTGPIGGSTTQVLFNNAGTTAGSANLTFDLTSNTLTAYSLISTTNTSIGGILKLTQTEEKLSSVSGVSGAFTMNCANGQIFSVGPLAANITANFTNLNLDINNATNLIVFINQNTTPFIANVVQIAGLAQTVNWQASTIPTGTASRKDVMNFTVLNTSGTYTVLGQLTSF